MEGKESKYMETKCEGKARTSALEDTKLESKRAPLPEGQIEITRDPKAIKIVEGFRILSMNMRDGDTGKLMWESDSWGADLFREEIKIHIPGSILQCKVVSREIEFSSRELIQNLRIDQHVYFHGKIIETWNFVFGFVIPGSKNSWQNTIKAADQMVLTPKIGNVTIESCFYDDNYLIAKCLIRVYYDA